MNNDNDQDKSGQSGIDQETERRNRENETGQSKQPETATSDKPTTDQTGEKPTDQSGSGFVGSTGDQSSDYLTEADKQDFAPEGQGADETSAGTADIETGQPQSPDAILDDGSDTSR